MATILNSQVFSLPPTLSGSNIQSGTIPLTSVVGTAMDLTSAQTVAGIKTFSSPIVTSGASITSGTIPLTSVVGTAMDLTSAQTASGIKTFSSPIVTSGASITSGTIPLTSFVTTPMNLTTAQTVSSIKTFTQQPVTNFGTVSAVRNTMYGYLAGNAITTGTDNTTFGYNNGVLVTSGIKNVLIGSNVGKAITTGSENVAIGYDALETITTGNSSVAIGIFALLLATGSQNVAVGLAALRTCTGSNNVGLGFHASINLSPTSGTFIGRSSGGSGTDQVTIGITSNASSFNTSVALGVLSTCTAANQIRMGTATEHVQCPGTGALGSLRTAGAIFNNTAGTAASTNVVWTMVHQGSAFKLVCIYLNTSVASTSFVFPTAFTRTPQILVSNGLATSVVTALSTTGATINGTGTAGLIYLQGF